MCFSPTYDNEGLHVLILALTSYNVHCLQHALASCDILVIDICQCSQSLTVQCISMRRAHRTVQQTPTDPSLPESKRIACKAGVHCLNCSGPFRCAEISICCKIAAGHFVCTQGLLV